MTNKERETYVREIAEVIIGQLYTNKNEVMAWGALEGFVCLDKEIDGYTMPTLSFKIRTPKVPVGGYVQISLDEGEDLYVVEAIRVEGDKLISLGIVKHVYAEDLHDVINGLIEDEESMTQIFF